MARGDALVELPANRAGKAAVRRIDEAERQLFDAGAYRPVPRGG
jgi:hypothetical protein